jgi:hypothetical protein
MQQRQMGNYELVERGPYIKYMQQKDAVVKRKIPSPLRESNPRTAIVQPVAQRYE